MRKYEFSESFEERPKYLGNYKTDSVSYEELCRRVVLANQISGQIVSVKRGPMPKMLDDEYYAGPAGLNVDSYNCLFTYDKNLGPWWKAYESVK